MTAERITACPPGHTAYPSGPVADNAAELHRMSRPYCHGYNAWPCEDHWHVGHTTGKTGRECKAHPTHRAMHKRLDQANEIGRWR